MNALHLEITKNGENHGTSGWSGGFYNQDALFQKGSDTRKMVEKYEDQLPEHIRKDFQNFKQNETTQENSSIVSTVKNFFK